MRFTTLTRMADNEYQSSDEQVDEAIAANGYTFTASGRRIG